MVNILTSKWKAVKSQGEYFWVFEVFATVTIPPGDLIYKGVLTEATGDGAERKRDYLYWPEERLLSIGRGADRERYRVELTANDRISAFAACPTLPPNPPPELHSSNLQRDNR